MRSRSVVFTLNHAPEDWSETRQRETQSEAESHAAPSIQSVEMLLRRAERKWKNEFDRLAPDQSSVVRWEGLRCGICRVALGEARLYMAASDRLQAQAGKTKGRVDKWDEAVVQKIMDESARITQYHKDKGHSRATSVLLVVDDMADQQHILHATGNSLLNSIFIRARHWFLNCWVATQRPTLTSSIIRTQASALFFRPTQLEGSHLVPG